MTDKLDLILNHVNEFNAKADGLTKAHGEIKLENQTELKALADKVSVLLEQNQKQAIIATNTQKEIDRLEAEIKRTYNPSDQGKDDINVKYLQAFQKYLITGENLTPELIKEYNVEAVHKTFGGNKASDRIEFIAKTLATDIGPNGGYFIIPQRVDQTIQRIFETDPMRAISNVIETTSTSIEIIIDDQDIDTIEKPTEREPRAAGNTPDIGIKEIHTHELYKSQPITQKMLDTYPRIESWIINKLNNKFSRTENQLFVTGTGSNEAKGFNSYGAWNTNGVYQRNALENITDATGASGVVTFDGLVRTQNALISEYQANAYWLMRRATWGNILLIKDQNDRPLILDTLLRDGMSTPMLLGKPVLFSDSMESVASGAKAIAYGDFKTGYTIVNQIGMRISRDPFTAKPKVLFDAYKRVGADLSSYESIKINKLKS